MTLIPSLVPQPQLVVPLDSNLIAHKNVNTLSEVLDRKLGSEEYHLVVNAEGASLTAGSEQGLVLGRATWSQVLDAATIDANGRTVVPGLRIEDEPTYSWRGLMVDCARHFTPLTELEKLIDALALHRMNRLHLHLTDDQGWRVQIDGWPRLTSIGATRPRTLSSHHSTLDSEPAWTEEFHQGHYTQDELRALVAYADSRGIVLVPEIDLPGHMQAAIAAYPELGNLKEPVDVRDTWGISEHVLAPTDTSFQFVREVLSQILDIFPGQWIHVGGDECPTTEWESSEQVQQFMTERGLTSERQVQHAFILVAHEVITAHGRTMIGWDEILELSPPQDVVTMLWRPETDVSLAERHELSCIYANATTLYFDYYQEDPESEPLAIGGHTTLADTYATEELPIRATQTQRKLLLGVQGQAWREYIPTNKHLEYMIFPRLCALSEVAWGTRTNYEDFVRRLETGHLKRLESLGLRYRRLS